MIAQAELETYHHDGYVIPRGIRLTEDELEPLRSALVQILADNPAWVIIVTIS